MAHEPGQDEKRVHTGGRTKIQSGGLVWGEKPRGQPGSDDPEQDEEGICTWGGGRTWAIRALRVGRRTPC